MSERQASRTALGTAYLRAAHQLIDAEPRILEDPLALRVLGAAGAQRLRETIDQYRTPNSRALRAHVALRSRFAEDRLAAAVERGVSQYVILGAGFDTFVLRQPAWARSLRILEVDHPGTQRLKRQRLAEAGLAMPANAAFAQIDFAHESLQDGLLRHQVSLSEPTFFSWLGVTMYLEEAAIDAALRSLAKFPAGSEVVLTFLQPKAPGSAAAARAHLLARHVADVGEPFVSYFEPSAIEEKLLCAGFARVEFLQPEQAQERYFAVRPDDLPVPRLTGIVAATR